MFRSIVSFLTCVILCNLGEVYIFQHGLFISALEHARMLILSTLGLGDWGVSKVSMLGAHAPYLSFKTFLTFDRCVLVLGINTIYTYCHA